MTNFNAICALLNKSGRWQLLAKNLGFSNSIVYKIGQCSSPASELLRIWNQNHTVTELFKALYEIKEFGVMEHIRDFVDQTHRQLMAMSTASMLSEVLVSRTSSQASDPFERESAGVPHIDYADLKIATKQWSTTRILGAGTYGTVFRGKWKCTDVAIKRINCENITKSDSSTRNGLRQLCVEMKFLNAYRHEHILPLYGYSFDGTAACLVYQTMLGRSLEHRLHISQHRLSYRHRLSIATGVAKALQFLHTFKANATVHGDVKSANILLDANLQPKLGDFGLAREISGVTRVKYVYGSQPYMSSEFMKTRIISTANDVFSFGVVLFELGTGRKPFDMSRAGFRMLKEYMWIYSGVSAQHSRLVDSSETTRSTNAKAVLLELIKIAYECTQPKAIHRPQMSTVLDSLLAVTI